MFIKRYYTVQFVTLSESGVQAVLYTYKILSIVSGTSAATYVILVFYFSEAYIAFI